MNWVIVCFVWALWMSKHFWLHLWAHCFWLGFPGEVGVCEQLGWSKLICFRPAVKEALGLTTSFLLWPWIPDIRLHKYSHFSQGNPAKAPWHTCTDTNPAATPSQASKQALGQGTVGWGAPRFSAEFLAFPTYTEHVQLVVGGLYLRENDSRQKLMCKSDKYHVGQKSVSAFVLSNNTIFILNWYV